MKLLFGTGNKAKLNVMKIRLEPLGIDLIGLEDLKKEGYTVPSVPETGNTPLENARQKAMAYYQAFKMPVFSCDSGLYFDEVPDEIQPGVHVRNVNGRCLSDDEMIILQDWQSSTGILPHITKMQSALYWMKRKFLKLWILQLQANHLF